jgi:hypothetical protein
VDNTAVPSPSKFDLFRPKTTPGLSAELINLVPVDKKLVLLEFQQ